jgi:rod shape-determining protein MreD
LQATLIPQIRILGGQPDLVFLLVLSWSINGRLDQSVTWAFVGGIMQDLLSAAPTGASVVGMLLLIFGMERLKGQVFHIGLVLLVGLVIAGTVLQKAAFMIVAAFSGFTINPVANFTYIILPSIAYNLVFIWPVYWIIRRIQRRAARRQRVISS